MSIEKQGFLSQELDSQKVKHRKTYAVQFELVDAVSELGQSLLPGIGRIDPTIGNRLASAFFVRGLQSVQGAVLLGERGLVIEARTLVRVAIEALFYVGASIKDPEFAADLDREHVHRMDKLAKAHTRLAALRQSEDIETSKRFIEDARDTERKGRSLPISDVAAKAGMSSTYEGLYRVLSSDAHSNIMSIYSTWSSETKEPTISWGPDRDLKLLGDTLVLAAFVGLLLVDTLNSIIDDNTISAESHRLSRLYLEARGQRPS